jgi:hypothetical protein
MTQQEQQQTGKENLETCSQCNGTGQSARKKTYKKRSGDIAWIRELIRQSGTIESPELNRRIRERCKVNANYARQLIWAVVNESDDIRRLDRTIYWVGEY